ncbi:MAG: TatD family hydrolase [Kiritimatiellae bacterium]|nr:TatD family hydrolase [Kiritimatiellia bacterium]
MKLYDTHAHFTADGGKTAAILQRAAAAGVADILAVGGSDELNAAALAVCAAAGETANLPSAKCALGFDRDQARGDISALVAEAETLATANRASVAAIGEIGLDFHYSQDDKPQQCDLFAAELELAKRLSLPVVIHTREADDATLGVLDETDSHCGITHSFTGNRAFARQLLDRGFYVSISGIVTFRLADNVRDTALYIPDESLLIETDAPYLAPVPMRGKENESAFIEHTCRFLAKLRGTDAAALAALTSANAKRLLK